MDIWMCFNELIANLKFEHPTFLRFGTDIFGDLWSDNLEIAEQDDSIIQHCNEC